MPNRHVFRRTEEINHFINRPAYQITHLQTRRYKTFVLCRQPVEKGISFRQNAREQSRKLERAQATRVLPFPLGRKRKQKGPFCTALRQQKDGNTLKTVRRTFPNSTIHIVSNTWEGSFLPYGQKSPHEPRSEQSAVLPWPSVSAQRRRFQKRSENAFLCTFSLLGLIDKL